MGRHAKFNGTLLESCNELLMVLDGGTEEDDGWANKHVEVAMQLHNASLSIRHWKNSVQWIG
jgi:hypothetical protein